MNDLLWKIKQFVRQMLPIALALVVVYGGWTMYKKGTFRRGFRPAVNSVMRHVPFFGSRFSQHRGRGHRKSYAYYKKGKRRFGRHRHHGKRHRRHRRRR